MPHPLPLIRRKEHVDELAKRFAELIKRDEVGEGNSYDNGKRRQVFGV